MAEHRTGIFSLEARSDKVTTSIGPSWPICFGRVDPRIHNGSFIENNNENRTVPAVYLRERLQSTYVFPQQNFKHINSNSANLW